MSIRVRLLLSYIAMLVIPLLLLGASLLLIGAAFVGNVKSLYQMDDREGNPFTAVLEQEAKVSADIRLRAGSSPDSLLDTAVQKELEQQLEPINMGLIVRKNNDILYVSSKINKPELLRNLPAYGEADKESGNRPFGERGHWFLAQQQDLTFSDGSKGSIFIATDINAISKFARTFTKLFFISLIVILVVTNGALTYFVSRSIIRPLRSLKRAADQIKEGNLDFEVKAESRDEIGSLSVSFEQMRRKLKESVELQLQYEENRKELISNISHDLKTPITAIKGYVEGIMDGVTNTPEKLDKYVRTIYTKAVQMDQMIDELFLFSKLDLRKQPFHFEEVELISFLHDCMEELKLETDKKGVTMILEAGNVRKPAAVVADRDKLQRVFMNLIGNAIKYMDKDPGRIRIRLSDLDGRIAVVIQDNGQGIPAVALPLIFDRFYRADPSRNAGTGGSGLGLAIAKQIIEEHGGTIEADSKEGEGTSIQFTLRKLADDSRTRSGGDLHEEDSDH